MAVTLEADGQKCSNRRRGYAPLQPYRTFRTSNAIGFKSNNGLGTGSLDDASIHGTVIKNLSVMPSGPFHLTHLNF